MLTYRHGPEAERGGLDLVISLTAEQAAALGTDAANVGEAMDTALIGLANARTGETEPYAPHPSLKDGHVSAEWQSWLIRDTTELIERLEGLRAAAIRAHAADGGSYGDLADAMSVPRSTAQRRRDAVLSSEPGDLERWASTPRPAAGAESGQWYPEPNDRERSDDMGIIQRYGTGNVIGTVVGVNRGTINGKPDAPEDGKCWSCRTAKATVGSFCAACDERMEAQYGHKK